MDDRIRADSTGTAAVQVARDLQRPRTTAERMQRGVDLALELLEGCDHAGITLVRGRTMTAGPATDDIVALGDRLQDQLGEGPCLDTVRESRTIYTTDLTRDKRWETWGPQVAAKLGVRSLLSLLLYTHERSYGALNLYSERVDGFTAEDLVVADALATHLAVAMADGEEIEHRGVAMVNRTVIGQAEGIVMERLGVLPEEAFTFLRGISQRSNRKLLDVARELVSTRILPADADRPVGERNAQPDPV